MLKLKNMGDTEIINVFGIDFNVPIKQFISR